MFVLALGVYQLVTEYAIIIAAFLTGIVGPTIVAYLGHHFKKKNSQVEKRKSEFIHTIETQKIVNGSLNELQNKFDLDRVWLAQFHNGGNYYPGHKSMKKMSVSFESTAPGISSDIMKMQNLPVSFFSEILQKLSENQESLIINVETEEDYALQSFWSNRGVNCVYLFSIVSVQGDFIAVLGVDFIKREGYLSDIVFNQIKTTAHLLSGYVAVLCNEDHR
jgi:hypothetical protein